MAAEMAEFSPVNRSLSTPRPRSLAPLLLATLLALTACGDDAADSRDTVAPSADGCAAADGSSLRVESFSAAPPMCLEEGAAYVALIETNHGTLHIDLRADIAPVTVNSFVNLARYHYYDDTTCHRAIQNFVVQCGDPTATGRGGPGYNIPDELDRIEPYRYGSLAMANTGQPDSGGSQFFIITGDDGAMLPQNYTLFGQVIDDDFGLVAQLNNISNPVDGPPLEPIDITRITIEQR